MYDYVLIPGRHHVLSNFMHDYFAAMASAREALTLDGETVRLSEDAQFIWAVTSANHENTRRNPLPGYRREATLERFCADMDIPSQTVHVKNVGATTRFADYLIKSVEVESRGRVLLNPKNCLVATSTPSVIALFESLGYKILPIELEDRATETYRALRAWDLVLAIARAGTAWREDAVYGREVHRASKDILERYGLGDQIVEIHQDPLVGDEGDITETRDYEAYRAAFDQGAERKYRLLAPYVEPGRILDIGCATGSLIKQLDDDERFDESDFYGVEVAKPLYDYCQQRLHNGDFRNQNTFFYQRNIMRGKLFPDSTVNTSISISLTHEIDSYLGRNSLMRFIQQIYDHTVPGGVYLNLDVTGPEEPHKPVLLWLNHEDGIDDDGREFTPEQQKDYADYLGGLSTLGRFRRFVRDFRAREGDGITDVQYVETKTKHYARLRHADAVEFMVTKDYLDSWYSEMHERFCYFTPSEWRRQLEAVGFSVDPASGSFQNEWINQHRFEGKVRLYEERGDERIELPWPDTSVLMIARKA